VLVPVPVLILELVPIPVLVLVLVLMPVPVPVPVLIPVLVPVPVLLLPVELLWPLLLAAPPAMTGRQVAPGPNRRPATRTRQHHLAAADGGCWWPR
jgi:hypothetical protein